MPILLDKKRVDFKKEYKGEGFLDHWTTMLDQVEDSWDSTWVWSFFGACNKSKSFTKGPKIQKLENPNTRIKSMFREDFRNPASLAPNGLPHYKDYKLHSQTAA